jgi:mono/diheme cytochrome c family protein
MKRGVHTRMALVLTAAIVVCPGCSHAPGYPTQGTDIARPDKQLDFHTLYKQNCTGCHGDSGRGGAAIPLNNPAYLAVAGPDNLRAATAKGETATLMPPFAISAGGMLTDQQVEALVQGMLREWSRPSEFSGIVLPAYAANASGNVSDGQKAYTVACMRCHGVDGVGVKASPQDDTMPYSIVDTSYLALVSDQDLRSLAIAGHSGPNTPDWRSYIKGPPARALTSQEITDIVAWIAGHRAPPAQPSVGNSSINQPRIATKESK